MSDHITADYITGGKADFAARPAARVEDLFALLKPRVMSLVIFTALVGLLVAPNAINPVLGFASLLAIAIGAGASGALNMWWDAEIDSKMRRTVNRPIPAGRVAPESALSLGLGLSVASVTLLAFAANWLAAGLLAFTIFFYAVVYSMGLKRRTPQNIVIGGAAGALPPVVAWAAATGTVDAPALVLFAIIFMWTPPHFWALSLFCSDDYERAGVPMLPVVAGERHTRLQILIYAVALAPIGVLPWVMGFAGLTYGVMAIVMGALFVGLSVRLFRRADHASAKKLFGFSILYLFSLFLTLGVEALIGGML